MKSIYRSESGKKRILELYDRQLSRLKVPFKDIYIATSFGRTHLIETGAPDGRPLLVFHGGNATTAYNLLACDFLLKDFHIYAVDTIGHPGKSAETSLSAFGYDYGKWAGEVIRGLGYDKMSLFGGSFGGGIIAKTMCERFENYAAMQKKSARGSPPRWALFLIQTRFSSSSTA